VTQTSDPILTAFLARTDARCPSCGYGLRGCPSGRCPECGMMLQLAIAHRPRSAFLWWVGLFGFMLGLGPAIALAMELALPIGSWLTRDQTRQLIQAGLAPASAAPSASALAASTALALACSCGAAWLLSQRRSFATVPTGWRIASAALGVLSPFISFAAIVHVLPRL
jgi:hypothetical protein